VDHTKINLLVRLQHLDNQIEKIVSLQKGLPEEIGALEEDLNFTVKQIETRTAKKKSTSSFASISMKPPTRAVKKFLRSGKNRPWQGTIKSTTLSPNRLSTKKRR